jgi:hypothetical protein
MSDVLQKCLLCVRNSNMSRNLEVTLNVRIATAFIL